MKSFMKEVFALLHISNADDVIDEIFAFEKSLAVVSDWKLRNKFKKMLMQIIPPNVNIFVENFTETTIRQLTQIAPQVRIFYLSS